MDTQNIEKLLAEKNYDAVRKIIEDAVSQKLTTREKGAALTAFASIYMEISNAINEEYIQALDEVIAEMKQVKAMEIKFGDNVKLAEVRSKLNNQ
jgi:hypothetical protein